MELTIPVRWVTSSTSSRLKDLRWTVKCHLHKNLICCDSHFSTVTIGEKIVAFIILGWQFKHWCQNELQQKLIMKNWNETWKSWNAHYNIIYIFTPFECCKIIHHYSLITILRNMIHCYRNNFSFQTDKKKKKKNVFCLKVFTLKLFHSTGQ